VTDEEEDAKSLGGFNARASALTESLAVIDAAGEPCAALDLSRTGKGR